MEQLVQQVIHVVPRRAAPRATQAADFDPPPATRLLVLQSTPLCNIDCDYCYLPDRRNRARMDLHTVRLAARRLREDGLAAGELSVVWHAGEPLLLPPAYYDEAFAAIADELGPHTRVQHAMQTNATRIDDRWCALFARHGVAVGVSVDGPAAVHDAHRRTRRGGGTHAAVVRGITALRAHDLPFHAIAVVTADTLADPDAFYDWFEAQGIAELGCNFDEAEGVHAASTLAGRDAAHAAFLQRLLERAATGRVAIREFESAHALLRAPLPRWRWRGGTAWPENAQAMPLALVTVGHDGRWSTFSPEWLGQRWPDYADFVLGDVHQGGYLQALRGDAFARLWEGVRRGVEACAQGCAHFEYCGGGAPANKLYEHGDLAATETLHCRSMVKRPFDAVLAEAERRWVA